MSGLSVQLQEPDRAAFAPFGDFVVPPADPGKRQFFSDALHTRNKASAPVLHVNHVLPITLPMEVTGIERHPHAAQCFFPLDVSRYAVTVIPSDADGLPRLDAAVAFLVPGTLGVIFAPGVWHLGATVLDRPGHFTVLMWRGGVVQDDEFRAIPPMMLLPPD